MPISLPPEELLELEDELLLDVELEDELEEELELLEELFELEALLELLEELLELELLDELEELELLDVLLELVLLLDELLEPPAPHALSSPTIIVKAHHFRGVFLAVIGVKFFILLFSRWRHTQCLPAFQPMMKTLGSQ